MNKLPNKIKISEDVLIQDLVNESVILNMPTEHYYGLNVVGQYLWQMFSKYDDVEYVYNLALEEFDVKPEVLKSDMSSFIKELSDAGLISIS
ncbi:PqqD family protein [uncultured Arcticibacterium sp.]|uniref:PqqD family protein n=1 Tax=uncultured Arcticibacterium sp. TaxID=2173042 RepID=UPI0030F8E070